jgi:hypothetical protein
VALVGVMEALVKYHFRSVRVLTVFPVAGNGTVPGGQFDWGGRLPKRNGGAQRYPQGGWQSPSACKGRRVPDCETDRSSRDESRA